MTREARELRKPNAHPLNRDPGRPGSPVLLDPHLRLAAAVVCQAARDLIQKDPAVSFDALLWMVVDGPVFLDALGMDDVDIDNWILELAHNERPDARRILDDGRKR